MTEAERERAMLVDRKEYPQDLPCAVCRYRWMQHKGSLCPKVPGHWARTPEGIVPIPPTFGDTTFIPDVAYLNQSPDFDVV
jgi:hypothetical protein